MTAPPLHFDPYLSSINSSELKQMVRIWGGRGNERKDDCIAIIREGLGTPQRVRRAIENLTPFERAALSLLSWMGGIAPPAPLAIGLRASGVDLPKTRGWSSNPSTELIDPLIKRGLLLSNYASNPGALYEYGFSTMVFCDERLLAHATALAPVPLQLAPTPAAPDALYRRPPTVVMDVIGVLQAIEKLDGLLLTKAGAVRAGDTRKLAKALGWTSESAEIDGLHFPSPASVLPSVLYEAGLLDMGEDRLMLTGSAEQFARRSYAAQVSGLFQGFLRAQGWREWGANDWYDANDSRPSQARLALAILLAGLPTDTRDFYAIDDLDQALFARIGEHFSLSFMTHPPYPYNKTAEQIKREQEAWRKKLREEWLKRERVWLQAALTSWLYYLGMVELGLSGGTPVSFRLTELGRAILHPQLDSALDTPAQSAAGAWLIQPDFEALVYLDRATAEQIAFMERHAERLQAQQHIARYRLTREAIYQGLESGTTPEQLMDGLRAGSSAELPQNVLATVRDWAAQRERITLRRAAQLLEFADAAARQAAMQAGIAGTAVGERLLLLAAPLQGPAAAQIDYALPLPACLRASEEGLLTLTNATPDLLLRPQIDRWAEPVDLQSWRLTEASVAAAVKAKLSIDELIDLLRARLTHSLPPILSVALRAWGGEHPAAALANVAVLRCTRPVVFSAIASSALFRPYLRGALAPDLLLVDSTQIEPLRQRLAWAGLDVADVLELK